jgi:hypothetical protein
MGNGAAMRIAAIVGGIVALSVGGGDMPGEWLKNREPVSF